MMRCTLRGLIGALAAATMMVEASASDAPLSEPLHPAVVLLDSAGHRAIDSGNPVSTMRTCAACHDTEYIERHSYHAALGLDELVGVGTVSGGRAWDYGAGGIGRWDPLTYGYLTPPGDLQLDAGVADWVQLLGWRHVGGGIAERGFGEGLLHNPTQAVAAGNGIDPDHQVLDPETGEPRPWDWGDSGRVEMNCFLCHCEQPDNTARVRELQEGRFGWANTATLAQTGLVAPGPSGWQYDVDKFATDGAVRADQLGLCQPSAAHCGQCHGTVHEGTSPLMLELSLRQWSTATKGQVFSGQRIFDSAVNLQNKPDLSRPWDVHAESMLDCRSCHFSLNNPAKFEASPRNRPEHLVFEPRRLSFEEYLRRPNHQFAKGQTAQGRVAQHLAGSMRRCEDCHDAANTHDWLPYRAVHFDRLSCEACHIPRTYAPALSQVDWTMPDAQGDPATQWRGIESTSNGASAAVVRGFQPVLLPRTDLDGRTRLVPSNLITFSYWIAGPDVPRPVRQFDLRQAFLTPDGHHPDLVAVLDTDGDNRLIGDELRLDSSKKAAAAEERLRAIGLEEPRIVTEVQPYELHHGVGPASWATRTCETCHARDSLLGQPLTLATYLPGAILPVATDQSDVSLAGTIAPRAGGEAAFQPSTRDADLYVLGHDSWSWVNLLGLVLILATLIGSGIHAGLRIRHKRWWLEPEIDGRKVGDT